MLLYIPPEWWIVVRSMTVASWDDPIIHLQNHLKHGVLSLREMQKVWIDPIHSRWWLENMHTPPNEISVYDWNDFSYEAKNSDDIWWHQIAILLPKPTSSWSSIKNLEVDHPVIKDIISISDRKVKWIWVNNQVQWLLSKVQEAIFGLVDPFMPIIANSGIFWQYKILDK